MRVNGVQLRVRGKVQGVGFRPFVWQLAHQLGLAGDVCNDGEGVLGCVSRAVGVTLPRDCAEDCPLLARIDRIETQPFSWTTLPDEFVIRHSESGAMDTQIVPDAATCPACLGGDARSPRTSLPLPVYQLHPLRAAVYHYPRHAL